MAHHRSVGLRGSGPISHWAAADQMGRDTHRRGLFPRYRPRLPCLGRIRVIIATALSLVASSAVGSVTRTAGSVAGAAAEGASTAAVQSGGIDPMGYLVDTLFRSDRPSADANSEEIRAEASRIIVSGLRIGDIPASDKTYLAQLIAARTGISQADAEKRVDAAIAKAKDAENK